ncbi:MAG TPA: hypothetical protein VN951_00645 [Pyrinomonadaceae bacterium]|nr:hypothetical protein [Pyrinomonadaceae bacterium]
MKERELLAEKRALEAEILERQEQIRAVEILLNRIRQQNGQSPMQAAMSGILPAAGLAAANGHKRVRGTLKAAKDAVDTLPQGFSRADLFKKIEEINPSLAGKIRPEAQRSTIRTLLKDGWMFVESEATETTEATYRGTILIER